MIKDWKLEITENEMRLIIQDGAAMSSDILDLARSLTSKYHLDTLSIYNRNGSKYFDYTLEEDESSYQVEQQIKDSDLLILMKKAGNRISNFKNVESVRIYTYNTPRKGYANCFMYADFEKINEDTDQESFLYRFDLKKQEWVRNGEEL